MPSDPAESLITGAMVGGGESREHIEYNAHTQVLVPLLQDAVLIGTVLVVVAGLWLLGAGLLDVARRCETGWDLLLFAVLIVLGLTAAAGLVLSIVRKWAAVSTRRAPPWLSLAAYAGGILWVMALLNLLRLADGQWSVWETARLATGLALVLGVPFLTYRFFRELLNPKYPPSPTTDMLIEYIRSKLAAQEPEVVMVRRPIPIRANNQRADLDYERPAEREPAPVQETVIDEDFVDLVALVIEAARVGWARERHVTRPRQTMPSGRKLTRPLFEDLVKLAVWWELISEPAPGQSPEWLMEPEQAIRELDRILGLQYGRNGQVRPVDEDKDEDGDE
jgi:hypothetical protein